MPYLHHVGNLDQLARVCGTAGYVAIAERRYREALAWLDEALDAARRLDDPASCSPFSATKGSRGSSSTSPRTPASASATGLPSAVRLGMRTMAAASGRTELQSHVDGPAR
jgi:hypothetical protein